MVFFLDARGGGAVPVEREKAARRGAALRYSCSACAGAGGVCVYDPLDLGIAIGSAAAVAAERHIDNRIMFSCGRAANSLGLLDGAPLIMGIPLSVTGKSPFFDRKPKT